MELKCECCNDELAVGAAAIPGMPISIAWGRKCLSANIVPYWAAVANTAMIGGLEGAAAWWRELVDNTLIYFSKSLEQFNEDVQLDISKLNGMN